MSCKHVLSLAVFRGMLCSFLAALVLFFLSMWVLPSNVSDPMYNQGILSDLVGIVIWIVAIALGVLEGLRTWKKHNK